VGRFYRECEPESGPKNEFKAAHVIIFSYGMAPRSHYLMKQLRFHLY
jgi:hypothetical protein